MILKIQRLQHNKSVPEYKTDPQIDWGDEIISLPVENKFIKIPKQNLLQRLLIKVKS